MRTRTITALTAAAAVVLITANPGTASAATTHAAPMAATSKVYVVHGIPGTPVDVWVNDVKTLPNFAPKDVAGPLDLPEGSYNLALTAPGAADTSTAILKVNGAAVPGGANISLVAHLKADGSPTITAFVNDVSPVAAGKARLIVRHTAAAPAVDIRAGGTPVFTALTNPNEAKADIAAGSISADVVAAGTSTVVLGPTTLNLAEGTATIVYAIGSLDKQSLDLVAQVISGLHSTPGGVNTGTGGLADQSPPWWAYALIGVVLIGVLGAGARVAMARRR